MKSRFINGLVGVVAFVGCSSNPTPVEVTEPTLPSEYVQPAAFTEREPLQRVYTIARDGIAQVKTDSLDDMVQAEGDNVISFGMFRLTYYYTPRESEFDTYGAFLSAVSEEGVGLLNDGTMIIPWESVVTGYAYSPTSSGVDAIPFMSVAADRRVIATGSKLWIDVNSDSIMQKQEIHYAHDVGGGVEGLHIDVYVGYSEGISIFRERYPSEAPIYILE